MPKHKKPRVGVKLDMTPLVDVAFLLLTFFMLTTQFKPPEEVSVDIPVSHSAIKLPEANVLLVTINKEGKVYLGIDSPRLMGILFGSENRLKNAVQVEKGQLGNLLIQARINNPNLRTVLKGDKNAPYGPVEDVIDVLQKAKITRFNMVTDLEKG